MITKALARFLMSDADLVDPIRMSARESLRQLVGKAIFRNRRPQGAPTPCITLALSSGLVNSGLSGPVNVSQPVIDVTIWDTDRPDHEGDHERIFEALKSLLHQYRGPLDDDTEAQAIHLETEPFERPFDPIDGSDRWTHAMTCSFQVAYNITAPTGVN